MLSTYPMRQAIELPGDERSVAHYTFIRPPDADLSVTGGAGDDGGNFETAALCAGSAALSPLT